MGSDAGLGGLTPGWKIRPREVPTAWVVRSGYAPRTTLHARPRRRPCITPSCPLEVVNFIQTPGRPMGAHSRDRAAAARRPGFPSILGSRTHPGFRSTRTDAGRAKGRQCMRHSTIVTLDVLGPRSIRPRAVPRLSNPPDPRHTPPRQPRRGAWLGDDGLAGGGLERRTFECKQCHERQVLGTSSIRLREFRRHWNSSRQVPTNLTR
jgi:hypothetical protein